MTLYASNEGVKAERGHTESERVLSTAVSFYASNCCRFMIQVTHHPPPPAAAASPNDGMRTLFVHLCVVPSPPRRVAPGFTRPACVESLYRARLSISQLSAPARGNESSMRSLQETDFGTIPMPHEKGACDALQRGGACESVQRADGGKHFARFNLCQIRARHIQAACQFPLRECLHFANFAYTPSKYLSYTQPVFNGSCRRSSRIENGINRMF